MENKEHNLQDKRCECCGYMTYHREHLGCIRAAEQARQAEPVAPAVKESLTAQPEPVALSLPFFAYDSETGFERFATEAEAKQYVQDGIDECRSNMPQGEAWPSEIEKLCWGVVLGGTKEIKLGDAGDGSGDYYSDYVLTDAAQPPVVAVPDGYALVPIKPTETMCFRGCEVSSAPDVPAEIWNAMLAAAPQAATDGDCPNCGAELDHEDWPAAAQKGGA